MSRVEVDGVGIEYDVFGAGRPVVLLHGFPDTGRLWRHQAPMLAEAGFQVIVPDLRGYGRSDKPEAVDAYSSPVLAGDVMAILAAQGIGKAHVVGHDWGAGLAWAMASFAPGNVDHLVVLSVGHPATFMRTFEQRQKSWYTLLFQVPANAADPRHRVTGPRPSQRCRRSHRPEPGRGRGHHPGKLTPGPLRSG